MQFNSFIYLFICTYMLLYVIEIYKTNPSVRYLKQIYVRIYKYMAYEAFKKNNQNSFLNINFDLKAFNMKVFFSFRMLEM